jgi:2-polyprenyl-3-methyl-5-hydroxy-6-metoxy-1,4-benzoquinol methylase
MRKEEKKDSIGYWDRHAKNWERMAYDKEKKFMTFSSSGQRGEITIKEIEKLSGVKNTPIIDVGCADGNLVINLLKRGFKNVTGIDNSKKMIEVAKSALKKEAPNNDADRIFFVADADNLDESTTFDFVIAMGLIEYLLDINSFFSKLSNILNPGGFALVESRNRLFNLFSANRYTYESDIETLVSELKDIKRFSPIRNKKEIESVVIKTAISIGKAMDNKKPETGENTSTNFEKFPFKLPQLTPKEMEDMCNKNRLKLEYVIYYHPHPFPPQFEGSFPAIFNEIALLMQPLGYTPLGATICSSFIAVIKK